MFLKNLTNCYSAGQDFYEVLQLLHLGEDFEVSVGGDDVD